MRLAVAFMFLAACASWTRTEKGLAVAYATETTVDAVQTRSIVNDCAEVNPLIGRCGDRIPVPVYFPLLDIAVIGAAALMPHGWRTAFLAFMSGQEADVVYVNSLL